MNAVHAVLGAEGVLLALLLAGQAARQVAVNPTWTGGAAIDAGDNAPPGGFGMLDLRGQARIYGEAVDIGAYEADDVLFRGGFES